MRHITLHHTGSVVDEDTCALFVAIERTTCSTPSCGGLRRSGARVCNRCGQATPARPPAVGDIIMEPPSAPTAADGVAGAEDGTAAPLPGARVELPQLQLPTNFTQRIRLLPANTWLRIPSSCRLRMIAATAQCWQGMVRGSDDLALLEEGRSKLLLAPQPKWPSAPLSGRNAVLRAFSVVLRNNSSSTARRVRGRSVTPNLIPWRELTVLAEQPLSARTARPTGLVSMMLSFEEEEEDVT